METSTRVRCIHIPLTDLASVSLGVYVTLSEGAPDPPEVREIARRWAIRNLDPRRYQEVSEGIQEGGLLDVRVVRRKSRKKPDAVASPQQKETYRRATHVILLEALDLPYRDCRPYLRSLVATACGVAESWNGLILNRETEQFVDARHLAPLAGCPSLDLEPLTCVESSWDPSGMRVGTRGMEAFALPDIEVREVPAGTVDIMISAVRAVARWLVDSLPSPPNLPPARLSVPPELALSHVSPPRGTQDLSVVEVAEQVEFPLPAGQGAVRLRFGHDCARGRGFVCLIPPRAVRLAHPHRPSATWMRELRGLVSQSLCLVPEHSELMEVAHRRAVARLGEMRERFQAGLARGESLFVKRGFGAPGQGLEFMWIEVDAWQGGRLRGVLANEPVLCPGLRLGQEVELEERDVFDWAMHMADGTVAGNLTTRAARLETPASPLQAVPSALDC